MNVENIEFSKEYERLLRKYFKKEKDYLWNINSECKKLSEKVSFLLKKHNINEIQSMILLESLVQSYLDNLINELEKDEDKKDLLYYAKFKRELINNEVLFRTSLATVIKMNINKDIHVDLGYNSNISLSLKNRFLILEKSKFSCAYCGRKPPEVELELEHIIPKSKGGSNSDDNVIVSCKDCNRGKGTYLLKEENIKELKENDKKISKEVWNE